MERWPSGLRRTLGKCVYFYKYPGFESLSLRQKYKMNKKIIRYFTISYFLRNRKYLLVLFLLGTFYFLFFGYNVRTALVFYFIFISSMLYYKSKSFKSLFNLFLVFSPIILGFLIVIFRDFSIPKTFF